MSRHRLWTRLLAGLLCALAAAAPARAEILAMVNYESKTPDSLKTLKLAGPPEREEGIAILDVDPDSPRFGEILMTIPLPADLVAHHIFYDRTMTKAYITALGQHKLSLKDSPAGEAPVEALFLPSAGTPTDYVTNLFGGTL